MSKKRQSTEWKILSELSFSLSLSLSLIRVCYKEVLQFNNRKTNNPILKWTKYVNNIFPVIQMVSEHMERCSASLTIREMQIKTTMSYHCTPPG